MRGVEHFDRAIECISEATMPLDALTYRFEAAQDDDAGELLLHLTSKVAEVALQLALLADANRDELDP